MSAKKYQKSRGTSPILRGLNASPFSRKIALQQEELERNNLEG
jgi:hypothetical protein